MIGVRAAVAADTNIIRHPTPRRYLTALEELRGRSIAILPMVHRELETHLPMQASEYIQGYRRRNRNWSPEETDAAAVAASDAAYEWWRAESLRNDTAYLFFPHLDSENYRHAAAALPGAAFTDRNGNDQQIYAQAWVHGIDVLASRNRTTIYREVLARHFSARGIPNPPVTVMGLFEHTKALAETEGRPVAEVAFEAMLGAVIPETWQNEPVSGGVELVEISCRRFVDNLSLSEGNSSPGSFAAEENELAFLMKEELEAATESTERFLNRCNEAWESRPQASRDTEKRYHDTLRSAVRATGLDPGF
ncbi:MAG: hypothetical protein OXN81_10330 [Alphaproteobacteria bacterium]|nr:hypothetical protein [Alphaproteobacteria bacterium]